MEKIKEALGGALEYFANQIKAMGVSDVIDIIVVSILIYFVYRFMRDRRAGKLALGVMLMLLLLFMSDLADMQALNFIIKNVVQVGLLALIIIFQPEFRSALEKMGGQSIKGLNRLGGDTKSSQKMSVVIDVLCDAAAEFSLTHTGALLVIEKDTKLGDVIKTGTVINADCSLFLIRNIFFDKAPLHDGAVIIRGDRIYAAGCFLPLSTQEIDLNLGTRHRAGLGMSENSDALILIVSEETGNITIAKNGTLSRCNDLFTLRKLLQSELTPEQPQKRGIMRRRSGKNGAAAGSDIHDVFGDGKGDGHNE